MTISPETFFLGFVFFLLGIAVIAFFKPEWFQ